MQYKAKNRTKLYRQNNNPYRLHFDLQEFNKNQLTTNLLSNWNHDTFVTISFILRIC